MTNFSVLAEIKEIITRLDTLDKYFDGMSEQQSNIDLKLCDLYHYIENNTLKTNECYRITKEIKKQRQLRRNLKNDYELLKIYKGGYTRLNNEANRKMLLADVHKRNKELGKKYKNRVYTEEEIEEILGGKTNE